MRVDLVGLVTPGVARSEGGYSHKHGAAFVDAVLSAKPRYVILPSDYGGCTLADLASPREWISGRSLVSDPRFASGYSLRARLPFEEGPERRAASEALESRIPGREMAFERFESRIPGRELAFERFESRIPGAEMAFERFESRIPVASRRPSDPTGGHGRAAC